MEVDRELSCWSLSSNKSKGNPPAFGEEPSPSARRTRPESPLSLVSLSSNKSKGNPPAFGEEPSPSARRTRPASRVFLVSLSSNKSKGNPPAFGEERPPSARRTRPESPLSLVSLSSNKSKGNPPAFSEERPPSARRTRLGSAPTLVSLRSDCSKELPPMFGEERPPSARRTRPESPVSPVSLSSNKSKGNPPAFGEEPSPSGRKRRSEPRDVTLKSNKSKGNPPAFGEEPSPSHLTESVTWDWDRSEDLLQGPRSLKRPRLDPGAETSAGPDPQELLHQHRQSLRTRCQHVTEGSVETGSRTLLNRIYTELFVTEGQGQEVTTQHEVRQLEAAFKTLHDRPILSQDLFKALPDQQEAIRVVLTNGVAGIGKSFLVQKFTLDWAEGFENQNVDLLVLFSFRELNLVRNQKHSILSLLRVFHPTLQKVTAHTLAACKVLLVLDGLDESRFPLDFADSEAVSDVSQTSSVDALLTNLIRGDLLPSARVWITSRPAAAARIPAACVDRVTEVRGFSEPQTEEYFRKRFGDEEELSGAIISHIKRSRSLQIMCQIPVFCWISATVLEHMLTTEQRGELPRSLTELYSHFLLVQTKRKNNKYDRGHEELTEADGEVLLKLGRLAFEHLQKGDVMFYQEDLQRCGLDVTEAAVYSGVCTEIFRRECVVFRKSVYCFIHLSVQEFLAAVYFLHCHTDKKAEVLRTFVGKYENQSLTNLLKRTMEKSFESPNGHLDLFVRFLHGLSLKTNRRFLGGLLGPTEDNSDDRDTQRVVDNLKEMTAEKNISPDRTINIFHCLMEMNDHSVQEEIQEFLLGSALRSNPSHLKELDLGLNILQDPGVVQLCDFLQSPRCRLEVLRLTGCSLTGSSVSALRSALRSQPTHLRELDLTYNDLQESDMEPLLRDCPLDTLRWR